MILTRYDKNPLMGVTGQKTRRKIRSEDGFRKFTGVSPVPDRG